MENGMSKCPTCHEKIFKVVPGETTQAEIIEFARESKLPNAKRIVEERWIHPGEYCPNGCTQILINYRNDEFWRALEEEFEKTRTCRVTITGSTTLPLPVSNYKIYIDGNIARTRDKDAKPPNGEFVWLTPDDHRIVVRESDVKRFSRLESNTICFTVVEGASFHFEIGMAHGQLVLITL